MQQQAGDFIDLPIRCSSDISLPTLCNIFYQPPLKPNPINYLAWLLRRRHPHFRGVDSVIYSQMNQPKQASSFAAELNLCCFGGRRQRLASLGFHDAEDRIASSLHRWRATDGFQPPAPPRQRESLMGIYSETVDPFQIRTPAGCEPANGGAP